MRHQKNINASKGECTAQQSTAELNLEKERDICATNSKDSPNTNRIPLQLTRDLFCEVKKKCPFQYSFTRTPDPCDPELEDRLAEFNRFVINISSTQKVNTNLTRRQWTGLSSLIKKRDQLHYSESDKCGEFVVTKVTDHKQLTIDHLNTTPVYSHITPMKKSAGIYVEIRNPTQFQKDQLIKRKNEDLTYTTNKLWKEICDRNKLSEQHKHLLQTSNTNLPCLYVQVKTHKNPPETFRSEVPLSELKVRPIISCVDCPTEKLAKLIYRVSMSR